MSTLSFLLKQTTTGKSVAQDTSKLAGTEYEASYYAGYYNSVREVTATGVPKMRQDCRANEKDDIEYNSNYLVSRPSLFT